MPGVASFDIEGVVSAAGAYYANDDAIVIAEKAQYLGQVVRHEMAHALAGVRGHPRAIFADRCAGMVACAGVCLRDAGVTSYDTLAPAIPASRLNLALTMTPSTVTTAGTSGWVLIVVTATNPLDTPIRAVLSPQEGTTMRHTFGFQAAPWREVVLTDRTSIPFAAGETKRWSFDVHVALDPITEASTLSIRGAFDNDSAAAAVLHFAP